MPLIINIKKSNIKKRQKKDGGNYYVQYAYAHTHDRDNKPNRYPEKIAVFPSRDQNGRAIAYPPGQYEVQENSFRVANNGFLELGFLNLKARKK